MASKIRVLVDVDGVVANLMGGFKTFIRDTTGETLDVSKITRFHIPSSPELADLHMRIDLNRQLDLFLSVPDCYQRYVSLVDGALDGLKELRELASPVFVTATLKSAPESYASKFRWCRSLFGDDILMIACPSSLKFEIKGAIGIDDRYDTCERWMSTSTKAILFKQPWNEAPPGTSAYDWPGVVSMVDSIVRRWNE